MADDVLTTESTVYVLYIASEPAKVWSALTSSEFTTRYFFGRTVESDWQPGSPWILRSAAGAVDVSGLVRESDPPRRLVVTWNVDLPESRGPAPEAVVGYEIEVVTKGVVRLTMTEMHPTPIPSSWLEWGRRGWPMILSGLKTLLETGKRLELVEPRSSMPEEGA